MVGPTDGRMDGRTDGQMEGRMDGRSVGRSVGRSEGRTDEKNMEKLYLFFFLFPPSPLDLFQKGYLIGNLAIYTVLNQESESEIKKCKFLEPGGDK